MLFPSRNANHVVDPGTMACHSSFEDQEYDRSTRVTIFRAFSWYETEPPASPHLKAMLRASRIEKGIFYDKEHQLWLPAMQKPNSAALFDPVFVPDDVSQVAVPLYDPDRSVLVRLEEDTPPDDDIRGGVLIYRAGQVRLGSARCSSCQERQISRETIDGLVTHTAPIPVCVTAGRFCHGICAQCFAMGGSLPERLQRCSVSQRLTYEEFQELNKGGEGVAIGPAVFLGESAEEQAWAEQLLF
ncbi:hypothetical protein C8A00DRAFT_19310 [Chaetomidium leptoderma]|uniref:Uncharacterized protein n=1 Tax=Chaetomidium leptoderma TaxID=669021 RepID=A0AAN6ZS59_9PEZI|nr:hypothetical protein C8A00DRAFT_19310 [Chaetomidium leptoderma]